MKWAAPMVVKMEMNWVSQTDVKKAFETVAKTVTMGVLKVAKREK